MIGVGVKNSTSDLLIANCDEFIYYDDLVREQRKAKAKRRTERPAVLERKPHGKGDDEKKQTKNDEEKKQEAIDLVDGDDRGAVRRARRRGEDLGLDGQAGAQAPQARLQRVLLRLPLVLASLLDEAAARGLIEVEEDEKSGGVIVKKFNPEW